MSQSTYTTKFIVIFITFFLTIKTVILFADTVKKSEEKDIELVVRKKSVPIEDFLRQNTYRKNLCCCGCYNKGLSFSGNLMAHCGCRSNLLTDKKYQHKKYKSLFKTTIDCFKIFSPCKNRSYHERKKLFLDNYTMGTCCYSCFLVFIGIITLDGFFSADITDVSKGVCTNSVLEQDDPLMALNILTVSQANKLWEDSMHFATKNEVSFNSSFQSYATWPNPYKCVTTTTKTFNKTISSECIGQQCITVNLNDIVKEKLSKSERKTVRKFIPKKVLRKGITNCFDSSYPCGNQTVDVKIEQIKTNEKEILELEYNKPPSLNDTEYINFVNSTYFDYDRMIGQNIASKKTEKVFQKLMGLISLANATLSFSKAGIILIAPSQCSPSYDVYKPSMQTAIERSCCNITQVRWIMLFLGVAYMHIYFGVFTPDIKTFYININIVKLPIQNIVSSICPIQEESNYFPLMNNITKSCNLLAQTRALTERTIDEVNYYSALEKTYDCSPLSNYFGHYVDLNNSLFEQKQRINNGTFDCSVSESFEKIANGYDTDFSVLDTRILFAIFMPSVLSQTFLYSLKSCTRYVLAETKGRVMADQSWDLNNFEHGMGAVEDIQKKSSRCPLLAYLLLAIALSSTTFLSYSN